MSTAAAPARRSATPWPPAIARLPREARDTLFLLAVIGWVVMPQMTELPPWTGTLSLAVLLWRGWLAIGARPLPAHWWRHALLAGALAGTWKSHGSLLGQDAGTTLVVVLLALKTLELRARRDALVVFFLGFFVLLTNFFHSQSLPVAAAMLIGLWGLLTALVNAHRPVGQPSLRESAATAVRMMAAGAPLMLALFLLFPRFAPLWGLPGDATTGKTGLSSSMEVGNIAKLALDESIAMRVKFRGAPPQPEQLYFRGPVLNNFDGRSWTAAGAGEGFDATMDPGPADLQIDGQPIDYEVTLEPSRHPWLLTLDVAADAPSLSNNRRVRMSADMQWMLMRPNADLLRYSARSWPQFRYGLAGRDGRPRRDLGQFLRLPAGFNPRTLALAEELRQRHGGDAAAIVQAAMLRLRTGGYTYTLEPGVAGRHAADEFWFDTKMGFCEHISSAFAVLMRAAGVPARIVTGFQGGETNSVDGFWTVRNSDAHAWAEIWLPEHGWQRVDPTGAVMPSRTGQFQRLRQQGGMVASAIGRISPGLIATLRNWWDAVDNRWNQWVLNYTQTRQSDLLEKLGFENPDWRSMVKALAALAAIAALGALAWLGLERRRQHPWQRLLEQARQRMRRAGVPAGAQATPRALLAHAQTHPAIQGEAYAPLRAALPDWLLAMERTRYAPAGHAASDKAALAALARQWRSLQALPWPKAARPAASNASASAAHGAG